MQLGCYIGGGQANFKGAFDLDGLEIPNPGHGSIKF